MDVPIELHGDRMGNCVRVSIALEEAGLAYVVSRVDLSRGEQREANRAQVISQRSDARWPYSPPLKARSSLPGGAATSRYMMQQSKHTEPPGCFLDSHGS
jgi:hypothetical protein